MAGVGSSEVGRGDSEGDRPHQPSPALTSHRTAAIACPTFWAIAQRGSQCGSGGSGGSGSSPTETPAQRAGCNCDGAGWMLRQLRVAVRARRRRYCVILLDRV